MKHFIHLAFLVIFNGAAHADSLELAKSRLVTLANPPRPQNCVNSMRLLYTQNDVTLRPILEITSTTDGAPRTERLVLDELEANDLSSFATLRGQLAQLEASQSARFCNTQQNPFSAPFRFKAPARFPGDLEPGASR